MLELLFNRTPVWALGVGTFVAPGLVTEAGYRLQRRLEERPGPTSLDQEVAP